MLAKFYSFISCSGWLDVNGRNIGNFQRVLDALFLAFLFHQFQPSLNWSSAYISIPSTSIIFLLSILLLPTCGIYKSYRHKSLFRLFRKLTSTWFTLVCIVVLAIYLNKSGADFSRISITAWSLLSWLWLFVFHILLRIFLRNLRINGFNSRSIVYWGDSNASHRFFEQIRNNPWLGYRIIAWFSPVALDVNIQDINFPKCSGGLNELKDWLSNHDANCFVFSHSSDSNSNFNMQDLIDVFGNTCSRVLFAPDWSLDTMRFSSVSIGDQHCFEIWGIKQSYDERLLKRLVDLSLTSVGLIFISPLLVIICLAIKFTSPGPILFVQDRCGLDGKVFKCFKFRTMYTQNSHTSNYIKQATKNDSRVTYIGRFLRRWSLDELPQLINVLIGDMSLVGPRPHALEHDEMYRQLITGYTQRHVFKPGITGLAQVSGLRGETKEVSDMEYRIHADLKYQQEWSLFLDLKILVKTFITINSYDVY